MAGRWPSASDPYGGRASRKWKAKAPHLATGGKVSSTKHPAGLGDTFNSGRGEGEHSNAFYHATGRGKRSPASQGGRGQKPERGGKGHR